MREILFFEPVYKEKLWGGSRLNTLYGMDLPSECTGECWLVSAHPEGHTRIRGGSFGGCTLQELWREHRDIFGNIDGEEFPLLIKIIDAREDLSIQVHPDEACASALGGGACCKNECWYVLDCGQSGEIVFGHNAKSREELAAMVEKGEWDLLLQKKQVNKGDFIYVASGTIHALKKGMLILEIQQPSDTTYRLYDYGRLENGRPRQLHIRESLEAAAVPHVYEEQAVQVEKLDGLTRTTLVRNKCFSVYRYDVLGKARLEQDKPFLVAGVAEGQGHIDGIPVKSGDFLMLSGDYGDYSLEGNMTLIMATQENGAGHP